MNAMIDQINPNKISCFQSSFSKEKERQSPVSNLLQTKISY
jgi:hypothetical protein